MVRVYCDFDGTVAGQDVGNRLFRRFVGDRAEEIVRRYIAGEITARECLTAECAAIQDCSEVELNRFLDEFQLDPHFAEFVGFCESHGVPVTILSDGLDFYVGRLLTKHGLGRVPWFANRLEIEVRHGRSVWNVSFPYTDAECPLCGNCKRNHMLTQSADEDILVYVGDGISDRCPVRYADVVFAKRDLIIHCQMQNITYHEFRTFREVQERLTVILARKRIRHRREAAMARRDLFMQG
jgi:2-hydroxy-3-keto-5-methylthiopentenyl-1-phosphate phosphatase